MSHRTGDDVLQGSQRLVPRQSSGTSSKTRAALREENGDHAADQPNETLTLKYFLHRKLPACETLAVERRVSFTRLEESNYEIM